jgi:hypothetical protein
MEILVMILHRACSRWLLIYGSWQFISTGEANFRVLLERI